MSSLDAAPRVLIVSTFVLPHLGGVEMFAAWAAKELSERGFSVRTLSGEWPLAEAEVTVPVVPLFGGRWPFPKRGLRAVWREVGDADVVLANAHHYVLPLAVVVVARLRRKPVVFVLHGADDSMADTPQRLKLVKLWNRFLAGPLLRLTTPVALSGAGQEYAAQELGLKVQQLPYPLSASLPSASASEPDGVFRVVWAGRLVPEKDPLAAVAAVERLRGRREVELEVFGNGPLMRDLQHLAAERPWVRLRGTRPWAEVVKATAAAHAFLATSRVDNVYVSALESLAIGTPTVATRVGEVPAYYSPSLSHFAVHLGDSSALAEALLELDQDWERWHMEFRDNSEHLRQRHSQSGSGLVKLLVRSEE